MHPRFNELNVLLPELHRRITEPAPSNDPPSGGKPKSKPPLDINALDLFDRCESELTAEVFDPTHDCQLDALIDEARQFLQLDAPVITFANTSCHVCGGALAARSDASTSVTCTTEGCDVAYTQEDWIELLYAQSDAT